MQFTVSKSSFRKAKRKLKNHLQGISLTIIAVIVLFATGLVGLVASILLTGLVIWLCLSHEYSPKAVICGFIVGTVEVMIAARIWNINLGYLGLFTWAVTVLYSVDWSRKWSISPE